MGPRPNPVILTVGSPGGLALDGRYPGEGPALTEKKWSFTKCAWAKGGADGWDHP